MLNCEDLSEIVEHATSRSWGPDHTPTNYANPYTVISYCSERLGQIPFQLDIPNQSDKVKERIMGKLLFFNCVTGRVAFLKGETIEPSSYAGFTKSSGENQIDEFLNRIGYNK